MNELAGACAVAGSALWVLAMVALVWLSEDAAAVAVCLTALTVAISLVALSAGLLIWVAAVPFAAIAGIYGYFAWLAARDAWGPRRDA